MGSIPLSSDGLTMVCAPIMGESVDQAIDQMHKAKTQGADVVEVRLDCIKHFQAHQDLEIILKNKPLPVIIVYRPKCEGGLYEGDEMARLEALRSALKLGADYVDFELKVASDVISKQNRLQCGGTKVIVSCFLDGATPSEEELSNLAARMQATGADIVKVVTSASNITELARLFHLLSYSQMPVVAYSVGERGLISQLLSPKFGGTLVYGSIEGKAIPGLPTLESLRKAYKVEYIDSGTKIFGLISKPVGHSKGPILHNPTFRHMNFNGLYVPMFVDDLKEFFQVYSTSDFAGFSVGFPYKEAVVQFCDEVHPLAQSIGAVNTIVRRPSDGKLIGYNTDCEASVTAIEDALQECRCINGKQSLVSPLAGREFVLVGAGGAGRALAFGAKIRGARIIIFDIDFERAKILANAVSGEARPLGDLPYFQPEKGSVLANATPIGMHPNKDRVPVSEASLGVFQLVFDAVYTPRKTTLLKGAEAAGAIIVSGVEMFLRQAIGQFNLFTGGEAPKEFMREIVLAKF
ncbi:bifunctional 3-dehydroquinate dehydratase/shikimate dehydrogenase, chloroplastic-like isoform X2 [Rhodamnia argentea]|uniref:Bifunctional 3-dehydroquinate dehydratase/shikimate dehydrogenase, chloroplastic-like isoform X2 n=1 Tax=Rhodamnia argentea TaxID=178133 RepID=A0A8B8NFC6_9MYRT|nr:bifunctional 3-dehydroquinate dehydratase/shikimate dehydrogenase, chloroplastic-like isoform X2 [Rhodamnia argentea]